MENASGGEAPRRGFVYAIFAMTAAMGAALGIPSARYLLTPPKTKKITDFIAIADIAPLSAAEPTEIVFERRRIDGWKVSQERTSAWVVKKEDGSVVAFAPLCTHLGCAYHWEADDRIFVCPCHTSAFSPEGVVLNGPAPRPLDRYVTRIENGKLFVGPIAEVKA